MRAGSLTLTLWWLYCGMVFAASAGYCFRDGRTWAGVLYLMVTAVMLTFLFREARRIDREEA